MRGRALVGEVGLEWWLPGVLSELPRFLVARVDCASCMYGALRLVSEFWRPSAGKSSPNTFCSRLWKPLLMLDLDPVLLTVFWLCTEGLRWSLMGIGNPMESSRLPVLGRANDGDRSSLESKKEFHAGFGLDMVGVPLPHGYELALEAVGGFLDIEGTRWPDVSSTASCWRWLEKGFGRCEGSLGGGGGPTVWGEMSLSFSMLHHGRQWRLLLLRWLWLWPCLGGGGAGTETARDTMVAHVLALCHVICQALPYHHTLASPSRMRRKHGYIHAIVVLARLQRHGRAAQGPLSLVRLDGVS